MKRILLSLFAVLVFSAPAFAGWNIKQNDDGTAQWIDDVGVTHPIGSVYLNLLIENVSTAATYYVTSPITDAKITRVDAVILGQITGAAAVLQVQANGTFTTLSQLSLTSEGATGTVYTLSPTATNTLEQGQTINIYTTGASTNDIDAVVTITLERR